MLDKLKSYASKVIPYLVTVLGFLGYIFFLKQKDNKLEADIASAKANKEVDKTLVKLEEVNETTANDLADYERAKQQLLSTIEAGHVRADSESVRDGTKEG